MSAPRFVVQQATHLIYEVFPLTSGKVRLRKAVDELLQLFSLACCDCLICLDFAVYGQGPLNLGHRCVVVLGHSPVVHSGVDHRRVEPLVSQELLDCGDRTTCVEKLSGEGVAELVRRDHHTTPLSVRPQPRRAVGDR